MSNYAVVEDGSVINVILWDGDETIWSPEEGCEAIPIPLDTVVAIGDSYADGEFSAPVSAEPTNVK